MTLNEKRIALPNSTAEGFSASIPVIGLGTWQSPAGKVAEAVEYALKEAGYRHIDGAFAYGNEKEVGQGIKASGVPRSEIFLTSKIWSTYHRRVAENVDLILEALDTDYVDLLLMHWPFPLNQNGNHPLFPKKPDGTRDHDEEWDIKDTWKQLEEVLASGKARNIGVSNCSEWMLQKILPYATIKPAVNQVELHIYNPQHNLLGYLKSEGIVAQAYSPLGSTDSPLMKDELVVELAEKYNAEPAQVLIGYLAAKDIVVLPKSVTSTRIQSNFHPAELSSEDIARLDKLAGEGGKQNRFVTPPWGKKVGFEDWDMA
ncbi:Aldo/keto reductase [Clavulina sp. PMI_390]|nr:Aldo/keto reductase [Clavulina sp. PMI_390]